MDIRYLWTYIAPLKELNTLIPPEENVELLVEGWYRSSVNLYLLTCTNVPNCNGDVLYFLYRFPGIHSKRNIRRVSKLPLFDARG